MSTPKVIRDLVQKFHDSAPQYTDASFKERWTCEEFIEPMMAALGWPLTSAVSRNRNGLVSEDPQRAAGAVRAPDYGAYLNNRCQFYVEAKKPSVRIKTGTKPAFQLRRYGWSSRIPLSILTDFEEFAIYDCRIQPSEQDTAVVGRVLYMTNEQRSPRSRGRT